MYNTEHIRAAIEESASVIAGLTSIADAIAGLGSVIIDTLESGGAVLTAGNGGSAAEALHLAEELSGRYKADRRGLAGVSLVSDSTALTCIANDYGFDEIFARQVSAVGRPGDLLVLFTTSGNSTNLIRAREVASDKGIRVACLSGRDGGKLAGKCDVEIIVKSDSTEHIQEAHQVVMHQLLECVEDHYV